MPKAAAICSCDMSLKYRNNTISLAEGRSRATASRTACSASWPGFSVVRGGSCSRASCLLRRRQRPDRRENRVLHFTLLDFFIGAAVARKHLKCGIERRGRYPLAACKAATLPLYDPAKPAGKGHRLGQFRQITIGLQKGLLGRILGQMEITKN